MLFGKRKQILKRILIVEDEPLTAFDNENILLDAGYEIVATVDQLNDALMVLDRDEIDLVLSDLWLKDGDSGATLAAEAKKRGVPTLFATAHTLGNRLEGGIGCLLKPYSERQLIKAVECVDRHLQGETIRPVKGLQLFIDGSGRQFDSRSG